MQLGAQTPFDGTTAERTALTDLTNHRGRLFFETDTKAVYMCDGASWYPVIVDHDHSGDAGDGGVLEIDEALVATGATTGHVLTVQADDSIAAAAAGISGYTFTPSYHASTSWDGDAKNGASGIIDLSVAFGVPAGVKAVALQCHAEDETVAVEFNLTTAGAGQGIAQFTQKASQWIGMAGVVECDSNGDIYFSQGGELDRVYIRIMGYWS